MELAGSVVPTQVQLFDLPVFALHPTSFSPIYLPDFSFLSQPHVGKWLQNCQCKWFHWRYCSHKWFMLSGGLLTLHTWINLCHLLSPSAHAFESLSQKLLHSCNCQPHFFKMMHAKMHSHWQTSLFFSFLLIYSSSMKVSISNQPQIISDMYKMYILTNLTFSWLGNIKNDKLYREKQFHNVNVLINSVL